MKYAVFVSAGLGDAVLMVPLVKKLKSQGSVTGFFDPAFLCHELFQNNDLFDEIILLDKNTAYLKTLFTHRNKFDVAYLNYFSATRKNLLLSTSLAKESVTNRLPDNLPRIGGSINFIKPIEGIHNAQQNLRLLSTTVKNDVLTEADFAINYTRAATLNNSIPHIEASFVTVQISSANNTQQYKNWPVNNWIELLELLSDRYENHHFMLIGDDNETSLADKIIQNGIRRIHSSVGYTSIPELTTIIGNSSLFIGLDGGPMHIAVSQAIPTFTIWGASDYNLYGYQKINEQNHKIVYKEMSCHPCNAWINRNTSRVSDPQDCPDFACISSLTPEYVLSQLVPFANRILNSN